MKNIFTPLFVTAISAQDNKEQSKSQIVEASGQCQFGMEDTVVN
jgi:hypothetical protein